MIHEMTHFKTNEQGGFVISKQAVAVISFILLLLGALTPLTLTYAQVQQNTQDIKDIKTVSTSCELTTTRIDERLSSVQSSLTQLTIMLDKVNNKLDQHLIKP